MMPNEKAASRPRAKSDSLPSSTRSLTHLSSTVSAGKAIDITTWPVVPITSAPPADTGSARAQHHQYLCSKRSVYSHIRCVKPGVWRWLILVLTVSLSMLSLKELYCRRDYDPLAGLGVDEDGWTRDIKKRSDPKSWLKQYASMASARPDGGIFSASRSQRPRAALISLVRNEELSGILQSMQQLEQRWNRRHGYPWIFFNEREFTEEFKAATTNATSSRTEYHLVPPAHWSIPSWIDKTRYMDSLDYLGTIGVGKGHMLSYHAMIRWQSGLFYQHPALRDYDWYWRVEPDVHFFCDIPYDPFRFMQENELVYGFNMAILDDARSFASLWRVTRDFIALHPHLLHPEADLDWLLDAANGMEYNNCQFFSNFEIASLAFWRSPPNQAYFRHLDRSGGFFYERYGDAPVHTLALAMFAPKHRVWFFRDLGYQHDIARHCPPPSALFQPRSHIVAASSGRRDVHCTCEPTPLDENFAKLVPMESPQVKPRDTCIRQWLGGDWLDKMPGWKQDVERALGGDGYGGYVLDGLS